MNRLTEPVFIAVSKLLLTEFGIHYRLESCVYDSFFLFLKTPAAPFLEFMRLLGRLIHWELRGIRVKRPVSEYVLGIRDRRLMTLDFASQIREFVMKICIK